jgi:ATP adenylyltransferase
LNFILRQLRALRATFHFGKASAQKSFPLFAARFNFPRMESLHAPWRIEYILAPKPRLDTSLFTSIAQSSDDEGNYVIARDRTCFALLNKYPYNGGHLMVVPYKEVADLNGLTDEELADLWKLVRRCINALKQLMKPEGFNLGINLGKVAGAGIVEHLHIHVVPRWNGDTNFMPVIANTSVLPQALNELAAKLRAELTKQF